MESDNNSSLLIVVSDDELKDPDDDDFMELPAKRSSPERNEAGKNQKSRKEILKPTANRRSTSKKPVSIKGKEVKSGPTNSFFSPYLKSSSKVETISETNQEKAEDALKLCPVCGLKLSKLVVLDLKEAHINRCLDKSLTEDIKTTAKEVDDEIDKKLFSEDVKITAKMIDNGSDKKPIVLTSELEKAEIKVISKPKKGGFNQTVFQDGSNVQSQLIKKEDDHKILNEDSAQVKDFKKEVPVSTLMPDEAECLKRGSFIKNPDNPIKFTCPDLSHQARSKLKKELPMGKKVPGTTFTVDAFNVGPVPGCRGYFLSHYHSDHYGGMGKTFSHGTIIASSITARLVESQIGVNPEYVLALETNVLYEIDGVRVILIDANHCPGAVVFLFEVPVEGTAEYKRILHTGDFRVNECIHLDQSSLIMSKPLDYLYLDTTYCNPSYAFPKQHKVLEASTEAVIEFFEATPLTTNFSSTLHNWGFGWLAKKSSPQRYDKLIVCGTYSIGKERIFISIARALKSKIFVTAKKQRLLINFQDDELNELLTDDPLQAAVHVQPMGTINAKGLKEYYEVMKKKNNNLQQIMGVRPTGWTFSNRYATPTAITEVVPEDKVKIVPSYSSPNIKIVGVPYSEHSSYIELRHFVTTVAACRRKQYKSDLIVIPTVRPANLTYGQICEWIKKWITSA